MANNISAKQAAEWLRAGDAVLIDVREPDEFQAEHIAYATSLPLSALHDLFDQLNLPSSKKIIFQCLRGSRGQQACVAIEETGRHQNEIYNIEGGITSWKESDLPVVSTIKAAGISLFRQVQIIVGGLIALLVLLGLLGFAAGFIIAGVLGAALFFAGLTGWCGLALLLSKMPWNKT